MKRNTTAACVLLSAIALMMHSAIGLPQSAQRETPESYVKFCNRTSQRLNVEYFMLAAPAAQASPLPFKLTVEPSNDCTTITLGGFTGVVRVTGNAKSAAFSTAEIVATTAQPAWVYFFNKTCSVKTSRYVTCVTLGKGK